MYTPTVIISRPTITSTAPPGVPPGPSNFLRPAKLDPVSVIVSASRRPILLQIRARPFRLIGRLLDLQQEGVELLRLRRGARPFQRVRALPQLRGRDEQRHPIGQLAGASQPGLDRQRSCLLPSLRAYGLERGQPHDLRLLRRQTFRAL